MPIDCVHLIGAGGHALVVIDALLASGVKPDAIRLHDQNPARLGQRRLDITISLLDVPALAGARFHICIGNNSARLDLAERLAEAGAQAVSIYHPAAILSPTAKLGAGCFVAAQAVVGPLARIGGFGIVNHGAIVDHECEVATGCHIAPNATLGGAVKVGRGTMIGAGATILPRVRIGDAVTIGAGAVVIGHVADGAVQVGVPSHDISQG